MNHRMKNFSLLNEIVDLIVCDDAGGIICCKRARSCSSLGLLTFDVRVSSDIGVEIERAKANLLIHRRFRFPLDF